MGLAFTNQKTAWVTFDGSTTANLIAGITAALQATGWDASLNATSPQGLTIQALLTTVDSTHVGIQIKSASGTSIVHQLHTATVYECWSNCCSFFIAQPGVAVGTFPTGITVSAGIPWTPPVSCSGQAVAVAATEAWYAFGDYDATFASWSGNPRSQFLEHSIVGNDVGGYPGNGLKPGRLNDAMWNGVYCQTAVAYAGGGTLVYDGTPMILTMRSQSDIVTAYLNSIEAYTYRYKGYDSLMRVISPCPIIYDPLIMWGDNPGATARIRGQIYDAMIVSRGHPGDMNDPGEPVITTDVSSTFHWRNFTDNYTWGSLWFVIPGTASGAGNVAY